MNWQAAVERTVTGLGYDLVDVERSARGLLRVFIDRVANDPNGEFITVDDCEKVTRQLQHVLEVEGCAYERLEVSSPGLDRPLKKPADFARFTGEQIELTLKLPFQGRKKYLGVLTAQDAGDGWRVVFNDGKGLVAVVAEAGEVKLTSAGGDTVLAAGQGARVIGSAPPEREAVPRSVLLKVAWPADKSTRQAAVMLRGEADPGAVVSINGLEMPVGHDGRFEAEVPLAPGANRIAVRTMDRFGRTADEEETLRVDRRPPPVKARSEGWQ